MRLVSFGTPGTEQPGILHHDGARITPVRDLDATLPGSVRLLLAGGHLPRVAVLLAAAGAAAPTIARAGVRLGPPVTDPGKIICIGLNYKAHAAEQGKPFPAEPLLFAKFANALAGPEDDIPLPGTACGPDYEVELALVIGRRARHVGEDAAQAHIAGYMVANDISARVWQQQDGQWLRAKSCDGFLPCGPALVTADEVPDARALRVTTTIAGVLLQDALVDDLIHGIPRLVSYISHHLTLEPGDIISTGTPSGVGQWRKPPRYLVPGELVECAIAAPGADLGRLRNRVALVRP
jgi:2-keto-4-pentenoate hydratase/2-oxohepta-3-ene-1,7-dioic acid hydratase in catechol pathway